MLAHLSFTKAQRWEKVLKSFMTDKFFCQLCKANELKVVYRKKTIIRNDELQKAVISYHENKDQKSKDIIYEILKIQ